MDISIKLLAILGAGLLFSLLFILKFKKAKKVLFFILLGYLLLLGVSL